jgi:acyl-CoA reductase-like NAD-dependent aldehyde dehydrogenase
VIDGAAADRIQEWVQEAVGAGAKILVEGHRQGNLIMPWLLADVPHDCKIATEEVFGPVLTLRGFESKEEASQIVNASRFGIHAGVFTRSTSDFEWYADHLEVVGIVHDGPPSVRFDALPYGGVKRSGLGLEGVRFAMESMTRPVSIVRRL